MRHSSFIAIVLTVLAVSCGGSKGPTSPSTGGTSAAPTPAPTAAPTATPAPALASCASWAAQQKGDGVPAAIGGFAMQRTALLAAGGGIRAVGSRYYAAYFSSGYAASSTRRVMIALHGTGGAPEAEWNDWRTTMDARGWGFLGVKYLDDGTGMYDEEPAIYANITSMYDELRSSCDLGNPIVVVVGFSRGSAQGFGVHYLDARDRRIIRAVGNNSGAWLLGANPTTTLMAVQNSNTTTGMSGTHFWMYCGGQDMDHGYPMCDEMKQAQAWVTRYGGSVEKLYEDPSGTHGGLVRNQDAISQMFSYFEGLR